jgi:N6-adenosine-specific RNA methylase IME4
MAQRQDGISICILQWEFVKCILDIANTWDDVVWMMASTWTKDKQKARAKRERELGKKLKKLLFRDRKYAVILADPEWRFEVYSRETGLSRAADHHYQTSVLDDIKLRNVPGIAAKNCVLFLWATAPMLPQALEVMEVWGFKYKSHFVWAKDKLGTGYWNRNMHELLLVGTRGKIPAPAPGKQWSSTIMSPRLRHSVKPDLFYIMIEEYFPTLPKIELNARRARAGWDRWGDEAPT